MPRRPTCSNLVDCDVGLNHSHASVRGTAEIGSLLRLPCARPIIDNDPCAASSERNGCCSTEPRSRAGYQRTHSVECRHASSPDVGCASGRTRTIERDTKGAKTRFIAPAYGKFESSSLQQRVRKLSVPLGDDEKLSMRPSARPRRRGASPGPGPGAGTRLCCLRGAQAVDFRIVRNGSSERSKDPRPVAR